MKPIYIALLEYGEEHGLKGVTLDAVYEWAEKTDYLPSSGSPQYQNTKSLLRDLYFECFEKNSNSNNNIWGLKNEFYFRLLEYRELVEARQASTLAKRNSNIATIISITALVASLYIGYMQLAKPLSIESTQVSKVESSLQVQTASIVEASKLGNTQVVAAINELKSEVTILNNKVGTLSASPASNKASNPTSAAHLN
jgi:hypothetical protein